MGILRGDQFLKDTPLQLDGFAPSFKELDVKIADAWIMNLFECYDY